MRYCTRPNRRLAALLVIAPLCLGTASCGQTRSSTARTGEGSASRSRDGRGYLRSDADSDNDDGNYSQGHREKSDVLFSRFGRRANRADEQAIATLVKRYYAAAAAQDGAAGCALLASTLAAGLADGAPPSSGHNGCAVSISSLFQQQHRQFMADLVSRMVVPEVRVAGDIGVVLVGFIAAPVGHVNVKRERGVWKMNSLLDTGMS